MPNPSDQRLDTGMKVGEAISLASKWWDSWGRHHIPPNFNKETKVKAKGPGKNGAPGIILRKTEDVIPAGILQGKPWADLTTDEQRQVVRSYHHWHVRVPQQEAARTVDQVFTVTCDAVCHPPAIPRSAQYRGPTQKNVFDQAKAEGWFMSPKLDLCPFCNGIELAHAKPEGTA